MSDSLPLSSPAAVAVDVAAAAAALLAVTSSKSIPVSVSTGNGKGISYSLPSSSPSWRTPCSSSCRPSFFWGIPAKQHSSSISSSPSSSASSACITVQVVRRPAPSNLRCFSSSISCPSSLPPLPTPSPVVLKTRGEIKSSSAGDKGGTGIEEEGVDVKVATIPFSFPGKEPALSAWEACPLCPVRR